MRQIINPEQILIRSRQCPCLYLYAAAGAGKTALARGCAHRLDQEGKACLTLRMALPEERETLRRCLEQGEVHQTLLLDQFEALTDETLLRRMVVWMDTVAERGTPDGLRLLVFSREPPNQIFLPSLCGGEMKTVSGIWPGLDRREIAELARKHNLGLGQDAVENLYRWSGGWPSVVEIGLYLLSRSDGIDKKVQLGAQAPFLHYVQQNLWTPLTQPQRQMCCLLAVCPALTESVLSRQDQEVLDQLAALGLVRKESGQAYAIPEFWKDFLLYKGYACPNDPVLLERAGDQLCRQGGYVPALECYYRAGNREKHRSCMLQAAGELFWETEDKTLKSWLDFSMNGEDAEEELYLKGMLALNREDIGEAIRMEELLRKRCEQLQSDGERATLYYLNLRYADPEVSAPAWLEEAAKLTALSGPIRIFSLTAQIPGCLCAGKELSELFCCRKKEIERFRQQWRRIFQREQWTFFDLAEMEYLMETNRMAETFERLIPLLVYEEEMPAEGVLARFGLLCNLFMRGWNIAGYEPLVQLYYRQLTRQGSALVAWNVMALKNSYDIWHRDQTQEYSDLLGDQAEHYRQIDRHNRYYLLNQARNDLFHRRFEKAYLLFGRLERSYGQCRQYRYRGECLLGQAVAAYGMGEETQAMKLVSTAMAVAECFRYVGIFSLYGNAGRLLLERYCASTYSDTDKGTGGKRSYYYGNVVGVSVENYIKVLLRAVRKNAPRYPFEEQGGTPGHEMLTGTETRILTCIEQGYSNADIAAVLRIEVTTVKKHIYNIYKKLGVSNRVQAIQRGKRLGLLMK